MNKKSKPRIAILTNYPADLRSFSGGVETATAGLLEGLHDYQKEFEFHIFSFSKEIIKDIDINHDGFQFHFLSVPRSPFFKPHLPYNILKAYKKIKEIKPALIHCQDNMALAIATIISGCRRIFTIHGIKKMEAKLWQGKEYWSHQIDRILEWFVHRNFDYFIAISPYVRNFLNYNKTIFDIPNPLSEEFFKQDEIASPSLRDQEGSARNDEKGFSIDSAENKAKCSRTILESSSGQVYGAPKNYEIPNSLIPSPLMGEGWGEGDKKHILYIGPLDYLKQIHILIEAFIRLKKDFADLQLIICGSQEDKKYYNNLLDLIKENNGTDITFIENLLRDEMIEYLKKTLALVLPSLQENSPMVIAEAMAMGVPVIASRVGGIPYMIEHKKTGLLFNPGDIDELAKSIRVLHSNKNLYEFISREAKETAAKIYNAKNIATETVKVYRQLLVHTGC